MDRLDYRHEGLTREGVDAMRPSRPDLLANFWTLAGPISPFAGSSVSPRSLAERIAAAATVGFRGIGLNHSDFQAWTARTGSREISKVLKEYGIRHVELGPLRDWWIDMNDDRRSRSDAVLDDLVRAVEELEVESSYIKCVPSRVAAPRPPTMAEPARLEAYAQNIARVAERTRQAGARLGLELLCLSDLRSLDQGISVLNMAGHSHAGLAIDIWHIYRGDTPFEAIAAIPRGMLVHVELGDGRPETPVDLSAESAHRLLPGDGGFDIAAFLRAVNETGYDGAYGVESMTRQLQQLPLSEAARLAHDSLARQLEHVR